MSVPKKDNFEWRKLKFSATPGFIFVVILWFVKVLELAFESNLFKLGIYPRSTSGLLGILTAPLIHSDYNHLLSNSAPLLVLSAGLFYFYPKVSFKVLGWLYIATGFWVWSFARESYHIGASGLVYGLASFLFFSGFFNRSKSLMAISLLVVFLYGSMVWGVLPIKASVSFESHALGALMGLLLAYYFRDIQKPNAKPIELDDNTSTTFESEGVRIVYDFVKK